MGRPLTLLALLGLSVYSLSGEQLEQAGIRLSRTRDDWRMDDNKEERRKEDKVEVSRLREREEQEALWRSTFRREEVVRTQQEDGVTKRQGSSDSTRRVERTRSEDKTRWIERSTSDDAARRVEKKSPEGESRRIEQRRKLPRALTGRILLA